MTFPFRLRLFSKIIPVERSKISGNASSNIFGEFSGSVPQSKIVGVFIVGQPMGSKDTSISKISSFIQTGQFCRPTICRSILQFFKGKFLYSLVQLKSHTLFYFYSFAAMILFLSIKFHIECFRAVKHRHILDVFEP